MIDMISVGGLLVLAMEAFEHRPPPPLFDNRVRKESLDPFIIFTLLIQPRAGQNKLSLSFRQKVQSKPEHEAIVVNQAKAIAVQGAKSEVRILFLGRPVAELARGHRVLLRVDDPQLPGRPVLSLLILLHAPHLQAER